MDASFNSIGGEQLNNQITKWLFGISVFVVHLSASLQQAINIWSWESFSKMQPSPCCVWLFPVHYQHFLSLAGSLDVIEIDGRWSAIDIDRDSKDIIALPRGERPLPGLLSASPSTLLSSSCHRQQSGRQAPSKLEWYWDVSKSQQEMPVIVRDFW